MMIWSVMTSLRRRQNFETCMQPDHSIGVWGVLVARKRHGVSMLAMYTDDNSLHPIIRFCEQFFSVLWEVLCVEVECN